MLLTKIDEATLKRIQDQNRWATRWYAYQDRHTPTHRTGTDHFVCLQVGDGCDHSEPPECLPEVKGLEIGNAPTYKLIGQINTDTGDISPCYTTTQGKRVSLETMVREEPEWAASRIRVGEDTLHSLRELLALIHRDGGQYLEQHGQTKAIEDAAKLLHGYYGLAANNKSLSAFVHAVHRRVKVLAERVKEADVGRPDLWTETQALVRFFENVVDAEEDPLQSDAVRAYESGVAEAYAEDSE